MTGYDPAGDRSSGADALPGAGGAGGSAGAHALPGASGAGDSGGEPARGTEAVGDGPDRYDRPPVTPAKVLAWVCLALPFIGLLWVGSYAKQEPRLGGFPFFFWYQLAWVFLGSALTFIAYLIYSRADAERRLRRTGHRKEGEL